MFFFPESKNLRIKYSAKAYLRIAIPVAQFLPVPAKDKIVPEAGIVQSRFYES